MSAPSHATNCTLIVITAWFKCLTSKLYVSLNERWCSRIYTVVMSVTIGYRSVTSLKIKKILLLAQLGFEATTWHFRVCGCPSRWAIREIWGLRITLRFIFEARAHIHTTLIWVRVRELGFKSIDVFNCRFRYLISVIYLGTGLYHIKC